MATRTTQRVPKYWLVKEELRGLVDAGEPGTALPTERELAEQLATSRTTVRQAIAELVVEGLLVRTQGSGTYIAEPRLVHIRQLSSFTDDLGAARVENRVLGVTVEPATGETARRLGATTVHRVDRVRIVDGVPLALGRPGCAGDFPGLAAELDRRGSLYATLRDAYGIALEAVEDTVQTHLADPATAELLGVDRGVRCCSCTALGERRVGGRRWTRSAYRGDRFRFIARTRAGKVLKNSAP